MCTVTFLPDATGGFILTSNRDEQAARKKADPPRKFSVAKQAVFYPRDQQAGGTWIATGINGFTLCLLNGAYSRHTRKVSYRMSRGLMLLDFFKFNDTGKFASAYSFRDIEPFTLIIVDTSSDRKLYEMVWDGTRVDLNQLDENSPKVWSSATLYDPQTIELRKKWFSEWLHNHPSYDIDSIVGFHETGGAGDELNDLVMNRGGKLFTVSITSIQKSAEGIYMLYKDLPEKKKFQIRVI